MKKLACIILAVVFAAFVAASAFAQGFPSSKAAWRFKEVIILGPISQTGPGSTESAWTTVLTTHIKAPNGKELAFGVSLQCGILTDTTVKSTGGTQSNSEARGRIRVRVKVTDPQGDVSYAEPNNSVDATEATVDGLTYCDRIQRLEAKFAGLNCTADEEGVVTCEDPEELRLILKTLDANHFNFLFANIPVSGVYRVEVQAKALASVALSGQMGEGNAKAFVGAGAVSVETIRLIKDADGTADLTP